MVYEKIKNIKHKKIFIFVMILVLISLVIQIMNAVIEPMGYFHPDYDKINISPILNKEIFSENDYKELLYQTGLGKTAIDEIMKEQGGIDKIFKFQEDFF